MRALAAVLLGVASPGFAQDAQPCDWIARADAIVEPWEAHSRTFANGAVRIAALDVVEPAAGAFHLLILSPPFDELGSRQCRTLGLSQHMGFAQLDFASLETGYDPAVGLIFSLDVAVMDAGGFIAPRRLGFTLNQSTGAIAAELR